jgi:hypothetical protein
LSFSFVCPAKTRLRTWNCFADREAEEEEEEEDLK